MVDNKFNIAVIGGSGMARSHMNGIVSSENAILYGVCDIDPAQIEKAKEKFGEMKSTADYRDFVSDPEVDAVVIVTPDQFHLEMTEAFLRAGKAVLCEKPMALDVEQCEKMMRIEKETGGFLMIGQICRCTPGFILAKKLVDEGRIGELFFVESEYAHDYSKIEGAGGWRKTPERSGFIGGGCHAVDLLRWIAGNPTEVMAYSNRKMLKDWPTDDCTIAAYKFPNDVIGKVFVSTGCHRNYTMRTVLYGSKGTIICDNTSPEITLFEDGEPLENGKAHFTLPEKLPVDVNNHNTVAEIDMFVKALADGGKPPVSSMEGASTVAVCCTTVEAAKQGRPLQIKYPEV